MNTYHNAFSGDHLRFGVCRKILTLAQLSQQAGRGGAQKPLIRKRNYTGFSNQSPLNTTTVEDPFCGTEKTVTTSFYRRERSYALAVFRTDTSIECLTGLRTHVGSQQRLWPTLKRAKTHNKCSVGPDRIFS